MEMRHRCQLGEMAAITLIRRLSETQSPSSLSLSLSRSLSLSLSLWKLICCVSVSFASIFKREEEWRVEAGELCHFWKRTTDWLPAHLELQSAEGLLLLCTVVCASSFDKLCLNLWKHTVKPKDSCKIYHKRSLDEWEKIFERLLVFLGKRMPEQEMFEKRRRFATFLTSSHSFLMGNFLQYFTTCVAKN